MFSEIERLAREAGKIVLEALNIEEATSEKTSLCDLVTEYDVAVQKFLIENISALCPDAAFIGEEDKEGSDAGARKKKLLGKAFIIDPIDGTTNFTRNLAQSAVSIAYAEKGEVVYACVYVPYTDELFTAKKGEGAFVNGTKIVGRDRDFEHALCYCGTSPYEPELCSASFDIMRILCSACLDTRRFGSAVIEMINVARGRADLYCELKISPWDHAAAALIARECGCITTDMKGEPLKNYEKCSALVASPRCHKAFLENADIAVYRELF